VQGNYRGHSSDLPEAAALAVGDGRVDAEGDEDHDCHEHRRDADEENLPGTHFADPKNLQVAACIAAR